MSTEELRQRLLSEQFGEPRTLAAELAPAQAPVRRRAVPHMPVRCPVCLARHDQALAAGAGRRAPVVRRVVPGERTCAEHRRVRR
jgi:hypothetical protein